MNTTTSDHVAAAIRKERKARRWTRAHLATRCGGQISEHVLWNLETGRQIDGRRQRHIRVDELVILAAAFGIPVTDLLP